MLLLPEGHPAVQPRFPGPVNGGRRTDRRRARRPAGRSRGHCGSADGPITIIAGEQVARDDARAELEQLRSMLRARVATVPDAKDVAGTPGLGSSSALGVTGVMGHPGVATAIADSALCLLVGTRLTVTARAGLDEVLASVPTYSIGSATPYLPCTHVHTDDLRGSLTLLTQALNGNGRPTGVRVPDVVPRTELTAAAARRPGRALPRGDGGAGRRAAGRRRHRRRRRATSAHRRSITCRPAGTARFIVALGMGGMGYSFGAASGVAFGARSAAPWSSRATARSSCTAWRSTPRCSTGCP